MQIEDAMVQVVKKRCIVYIDAYNWYHALFKHYPEWKWLNIQTFFEALRPHEQIVAIKMFSAMLEPASPENDAKARQERYFQALKTLPKVSIILGKFQPREVTCRAECKRKYFVDEEKKTDVNMAVEIISDTIGSNCESMCVVSGDSDIQPALEWVVTRYKSIKVAVYVPALAAEQSSRRLDYYRVQGLPVDCRFLPLSDLKNHQFPHNVKLPDNNFVCRPHVWQTHKNAFPV